jgi:hypothetical protein
MTAGDLNTMYLPRPWQVAEKGRFGRWRAALCGMLKKGS